jgi:transposase
MMCSARMDWSNSIKKPIVYAAIELSGKTWLVAIHSPVAEKISLHSLSGGQTTELLALFTRVRERAEAQCGSAVKLVCCYQAGYDGLWLQRWLTAQGIEAHVVDPASIQVNRRARRAKTDRRDAQSILRVRMADDHGESQVCSMVHAPTREQDEAKRPHRERQRLIQERIRHINPIKGLLATQGLRDFNPVRPDWQEQLGGLRGGDGTARAPHLGAEGRRECQRLHLVLDMIKTVEAERDASLEPAPQPQAERQIGLLQKLTGIGPAFASVLYREVFYRDFANRRQVASYVGLTPSPDQSGRVDHDQGISKAGNPRARTTALDVGSPPAPQRPDPMGPAAGRLNQGADPADHDYCPGPQADCGFVALFGRRSLR